MPGQINKPQPKAKKKSSGGGGFLGGLVHHAFHNPVTHYGGKAARDIEDVAIHTPSGILGTGRAGALDIADFYRHPLRKNQFKRSQKIVTGMAKSTYGDLRHPLRHPGYSFLDALSLVPGVGEAVFTAKTGGMLTRAGRLERAARYKKTRILSHKSKTLAEEKALSAARGIKPGPVGRTHKVPVPLAVSPSAKGAQLLGDALRSKRGKTYGKTLKEIQRESDILDRLHHGPEAAFVQSVKDVKGRRARRKAGETIPRFRDQPVRETNAAIRAFRLYRPGYILPNVMGGVTAAATQGAFTPKIIRQAARLRGTEEAGTARSLMGGGISRSAAVGATEDVSKVGPIGAVTRGVGESAGKLTDRGPRLMALLKEAHRQGHITDAQVKNLLKNSIKDPALRKDIVQVVRRAEPEAIRFSRTPGRKGVLAKADRIAAENVFLYKWITGSTAYAGHTIAHHPVKTAVAAQLGRNNPQIGDVLKKYPEWMSQYIPAGMRNKLPLIAGGQAYSLWSSPVEAAQVLKDAAKNPKKIIGPLNPVQHATAVATFGYDPFKDFTLKNQSAKKNLLFALGTELSGSPYMNFLPKNLLPYRKTKSGEPIYALPKGKFWDTKASRSGRLFPRTKEDILLQFLLGSIYRGPVNPDVAARMAKGKKKKVSTYTP